MTSVDLTQEDHLLPHVNLIHEVLADLLLPLADLTQEVPADLLLPLVDLTQEVPADHLLLLPLLADLLHSDPAVHLMTRADLLLTDLQDLHACTTNSEPNNSTLKMKLLSKSREVTQESVAYSTTSPSEIPTGAMIEPSASELTALFRAADYTFAALRLTAVMISMT